MRDLFLPHACPSLQIDLSSLLFNAHPPVRISLIWGALLPYNEALQIYLGILHLCRV